MRVLRGKSNLEVSSQGFALFVAGFILATFLGGAVRTVLSSERVRSRIVSELKSRFPRNVFEIGRTEILLSRGMLPGLGLKLYDVQFEQEVCGKLSFKLRVPEAVLPVNLASLVRGEPHLGRVRLSDAQMHLDYHDCPQAETAVGSAPPPNSAPALTTPGVRAPRLDFLEGLQKHMDRLQVQRLTITYAKQPTWKLAVDEASLSLQGEPRLKAEVRVLKSLPFGELVHGVKVQVTSEAQLMSWTARSEFKEGHVLWKGSWDTNENSAMTEVSLHQLPLKELSYQLYQMDLLQREIRLRTAWLTCSMFWEGRADRLLDLPVKTRDCGLEGAYGRVEMAPVDVFLGQAEPLKSPLKLTVSRLQLQPLAEALGKQILPTVLSRLGDWSGRAEYLSPRQWLLVGDLEGAEIAFSNESLRGKQWIERVSTDVRHTPDGLRVRIHDVKLQDGAFDGEVTAQLDREGRAGEFATEIQRLSFHPMVQSLLVGDRLTPVRIKGKGRLHAGEVTDWRGGLEIDELTGLGWSLKGVRVDGRFMAKTLTLEAQAKELMIEKNWRYLPQLSSVTANVNDLPLWRDVRAKASIHYRGGQLHNLSAIEVASGTPWRGRGEWVREGTLSAVMTVGPRSYLLQGERGEILIDGRATH